MYIIKNCNYKCDYNFFLNNFEKFFLKSSNASYNVS